ncbi:hypothetical protein K449DRAFT_161076 [Hypoxylon sp. EC38]|nr:hypothetical protein K449DRAFT_161076 [Hypoxylon sp. EC38]
MYVTSLVHTRTLISYICPPTHYSDPRNIQSTNMQQQIYFIGAARAPSFANGTVMRLFCRTCGSVFKMENAEEEEITIPIGILDGNHDDLVPQVEIYCSEKTRWITPISGRNHRYRIMPP